MNVANMSEAAAETWCSAQANCSGFTAHSAGGATSTKKIYFKHDLFRPMGSDPTWVTYVKVAAPVGPPPPPPSHAGLVGSFGGLAILDSMHMIVSRNSDVPLRTKDGGATWAPMASEQLSLVSGMRHGLMYSWTAKTLVMMGAGGAQTKEHPHAAFVWVSKDDGETWTDETGPAGGKAIVTMGPVASPFTSRIPHAILTVLRAQRTLWVSCVSGIAVFTPNLEFDVIRVLARLRRPGVANWYENDLYLNSMGQGIMVKTLEDSKW